MRILLVEDDDSVGEALTESLERHGHDVTRVVQGEVALVHDPLDLMLLDLNLPDLDGREVCRRVRATSAVPIVVISGRSEEVDRVLCLHLGADDYLVKPFGMLELLARVEAVGRRCPRGGAPRFGANADGFSEQHAKPTGAVTGLVHDLGQLRLDLRQRHVLLRGERLHLTRKEFDLLAILIEDPGAVFTRTTLLKRVWDENWFGSTRTVDAHVSQLRAKLRDPRWVETVHGVGFRLVNPAELPSAPPRRTAGVA